MRILFTKSEGSFWNPLYLHNIDKQGLENLLTEGIGDIAVKRNRNYTILKGMNVSSTILPDLPYEEDVKFHSLMLEDGTIFDSTFYYLKKNSGLDHSFFEIRDFGLPAKRFDELWKNGSERAHKLWVGKKIKEKIKYSMKKKRKKKK